MASVFSRRVTRRTAFRACLSPGNSSCEVHCVRKKKVIPRMYRFVLCRFRFHFEIPTNMENLGQYNVPMERRREIGVISCCEEFFGKVVNSS